MIGWIIAGLVALAVGYVVGMLWKIDRDNRPRPRWPGDP